MKTQNYYLVYWTAQGDSILKVEDGDKLGHLRQFPRTARKPIYDMLSKSNSQPIIISLSQNSDLQYQAEQKP